jgi:hypothetical protein
MESNIVPGTGMYDAAEAATRPPAPGPNDRRQADAPPPAGPPRPAASEEIGAVRGSPPPPSARAAVLVDALAVAWTTFRLYGDPSTQEAFHRALEVLGEAPSFPWLLEVSSEGFAERGAPIPTRRTAAAALAREAFARGMAALGFSAPPRAADLIALFEVISSEEDEPPTAALAHRGADQVVIAEHGTLVEAPAGIPALEAGAAPPPPAARPVRLGGEETSAGGAAALIGRQLQQYLEEVAATDPTDLWGRADLARSCMGSFTTLSRQQQAGLLARLLARKEEPPVRALLDQYTDGELEQLAEPEAHPLLLEYLRLASEQETRPRPLLQRLGRAPGAGPGLPHRVVAPSGSSAEARRRLAHIRPSLARHPRPGPGTLRALLALDEEADFEYLLPVWASRLAASLAGKDPAAARGWLEAVLGAPLSAAQEEAARAEVDAMLRRGLIDDLVAAAAAGDEATTGLVEAVAPMAAGALIHRLAAEPDRARRRAQVDLLGTVARANPDAVCRHLDDPRWYLVRNLVVALARSRRQEAVPYLRPLTSHADPRVRREVLRALRALSPGESSVAAIAALDDPDPMVRLQVLGLLGADSDPEVDALLAHRLASWPPLDEAMGIIEALARRHSRAAQAALGALAKRRWLVSPNRRQLRGAARLALGGKAS